MMLVEWIFNLILINLGKTKQNTVMPLTLCTSHRHCFRKMHLQKTSVPLKLQYCFRSFTVHIVLLLQGSEFINLPTVVY